MEVSFPRDPARKKIEFFANSIDSQLNSFRGRAHPAGKNRKYITIYRLYPTPLPIYFPERLV